MITQNYKKEQTNNLNVSYSQSSDVIIYSGGKELEERRKDDWKESKRNVERLYPRWRKGD